MARTKTPHEFDAFINAVYKDLAILPVKIFWRAKLGWDGTATFMREIYMRKGNSAALTCRSLAHELRHIQQSDTGRNYFIDQYTLGWEGKSYRYTDAMRMSVADYLDLPWEKDANEYEAYAVVKFERLIPTHIRWLSYL